MRHRAVHKLYDFLGTTLFASPSTGFACTMATPLLFLTTVGKRNADPKRTPILTTPLTCNNGWRGYFIVI